MNADILDFLMKTGLLWFFALSLFFPLGMFVMLLAAKRMLFKGTGTLITNLFSKWVDDSVKRTEAEIKIEASLEKLTDQIEHLVSGNWDTRRYFDQVLEKTATEHKQILTYLENILLLARKRKSDWMRPPDTEIFLQPRENTP